MRTDNAHQERPTVALDSDTLSNTYVTYGVYIKTIRSILKRSRPSGGVHLNILRLPPELTITPSTDPTDPNRYRSIAPGGDLT